MHHFLYPSKDTYITSRQGFSDKNFGINEILQVGTINTPVKYLSPTKEYTYTNIIFNILTIISTLYDSIFINEWYKLIKLSL